MARLWIASGLYRDPKWIGLIALYEAYLRAVLAAGAFIALI